MVNEGLESLGLKIENNTVVFKDVEATKKKLAGQKLQTVPYDPRFPTTNQTKNCTQNYLDFFRCQKVKGEDYKPCNWYKFAYMELCPPEWYAKWDEQREKGIFAPRI